MQREVEVERGRLGEGCGCFMFLTIKGFFESEIEKNNGSKWHLERFKLKIPKIPLVKNGVFGRS
ncbi:hypothetical protein HanIR_Chr13g0618901 [Helianthus annuus]|nr:hypothetical protein HanIR_Chr13g0618901 [Helianthus annuus]